MEDVEFEFEDDFWEYLRPRLLRFSLFSCGRRMSMISGFGHIVFFSFSLNPKATSLHGGWVAWR